MKERLIRLFRWPWLVEVLKLESEFLEFFLIRIVNNLDLGALR